MQFNYFFNNLILNTCGTYISISVGEKASIFRSRPGALQGSRGPYLASPIICSDGRRLQPDGWDFSRPAPSSSALSLVLLVRFRLGGRQTRMVARQIVAEFPLITGLSWWERGLSEPGQLAAAGAAVSSNPTSPCILNRSPRTHCSGR